MAEQQQLVPIGAVLEERFRIVREIGRGGMGTVYEARHLVTGKRLAVKIMNDKLSASESFSKRFMREAKLMVRLDHPAVAKVDAMGIWNGRVYLALNYISGQSLQKKLESGPLPLATACDYATQICDVLMHAHETGIVHRDLKPSNIMLEESTAGGVQLKLLDFGIAACVDDEQAMRITQTGDVIGSPYYMSPEQAQGQRTDPRTDIYALGCVLYEMISGKQPFVGETLFETLSQQINRQAPPCSGATPAIQQVISRALEKGMENRYQSAKEMRTALVDAIATPSSVTGSAGAGAGARAGAGGRARAGAGAAKPSMPPGRHNLVVASSIAAVAVGGAACFFLTKHFDATQLKSNSEEQEAEADAQKSERRAKAGRVKEKYARLTPKLNFTPIPEYAHALSLSDDAVTIKGERKAKVLAYERAISAVETAIENKHKSPKGSTEPATMYHTLAACQSRLANVYEGGSKERIDLLRQALKNTAICTSLMEELRPGWSHSYIAHFRAGKVKYVLSRELKDIAGLTESEKEFDLCIQQLSKVKEQHTLTDEQQKFYVDALSALEDARHHRKRETKKMAAGAVAE